MGNYEKAVEALSDVIKKDPKNKEAYFHRAAAYFEAGKFDEAIKDYLMSEKGKGIYTPTLKASDNFIEAFIKNACQGASESAKDFVPSLCHSAHGLSETLWAIHWSASPLNREAPENIKNFSNACYEMGECIVNYCKNVDAETIDGYVDQIKVFYARYDQLNDTEKGELLGYIVGRYSVDILAGALVGGGATKGVQFVNKTVPAFRNLRNANRICNLDAMLLSEAEKKAIVSSSLTHAVERNAYFKTVKINWVKQNKHIPGKHNYLQGRGTITMEVEEFEILVHKHIGTGQRVDGSFGDGGFVERVDFGKIIGEYATKVNGKIEYFPTSKGIIKYAKDGTFHVIPSNPEAIIK